DAQVPGAVADARHTSQVHAAQHDPSPAHAHRRTGQNLPCRLTSEVPPHAEPLVSPCARTVARAPHPPLAHRDRRPHTAPSPARRTRRTLRSPATPNPSRAPPAALQADLT